MNLSHLMPASAIVLIALLSSCGHKTDHPTVSEPVKVSVLKATTGNTFTEHSYSGTVESGDGADMSFTVGGTIKRINVSAGQKVSKGQLLAELDAGSLENANNIAQATLEEARDAYKRLEKLHNANALPEIKWVEVQSKLKQAENAALIAQRAVGDSRIYAPISGVVSRKFVEAGQTAAPGLPIVKIVSLDDIRVNISVAESEIAEMKPGRTATITADAVPGAEFSAVLTEQGVVANPLSRTYDVKFKVANSDGRLLPGMLCTVNPASTQADGSMVSEIILPAQAVLLSADNRNFVWLAEDGKAHLQFVTVGSLVPQGVVITSGIEPGDEVIVQGMQKVSEGTPIQY